MNAMRNLNRNLGLVALVLLLVSVFTYRSSVDRGDRFERGRKLLANLNPDEVAGLKITKGDEAVTLDRQGDVFLIAELDGYRAKNEEVNRFLKDLLDMGLQKEVGRGSKLAEKLGIEPPGGDTIEVSLEDASGKDMVRLRLGQEFEEGGSYVQRLDEEDAMIYLTETTPGLATTPDRFLDKEIVDVSTSDIQRIEGPDFLVEEVFEEVEEAPAEEVAEEASETGSELGADAAAVPAAPEPISLGLQLAEVPSNRKEKAAEMTKLKGALSRLEFEEVFPGDDPEVASLAFRQALKVDLDDTTGYILATAEKDDRTFLQIQGFSTVDRVEITEDESEEELQVKADSLTRADEIRDFNAFHGSWVYEIEDRFAEKLKLTKSDLMERAGG